MVTVAETTEYLRRSEGLLGQSEQEALVKYLSEHPEAGDIIQGTGGIRKLRWARDGIGKRGGVRAIYYYHSERMPLYLLTIYGKGDKGNLTAKEKQGLKALVDLLKRANRV